MPLSRGEIWRLISSNLVHFSNLHLIYNLLVFGVSGWMIEWRGYGFFGRLCLLMSFFIGPILFLTEPSMGYYGGLSGMACGAIYYLALMGLKEPHPWGEFCLLMIFVIPAKIVFEISHGRSMLPSWGEQSFAVVPMSHFAGILLASGMAAFVKIRARCPHPLP